MSNVRVLQCRFFFHCELVTCPTITRKASDLSGAPDFENHHLKDFFRYWWPLLILGTNPGSKIYSAMKAAKDIGNSFDMLEWYFQPSKLKEWLYTMKPCRLSHFEESLISFIQFTQMWITCVGKIWLATLPSAAHGKDFHCKLIMLAESKLHRSSYIIFEIHCVTKRVVRDIAGSFLLVWWCGSEKSWDISFVP